MKIPQFIRLIVGYLTKPKSLAISDDNYTTITQDKIYIWTTYWNQNKWGKWWVIASYGTEKSRVFKQ